MYSTPQLLSAIANEFRILKHLGSKVTSTNKDHKLTDSQRSTEELQKYIAYSLPAQIKLMVLGTRDGDLYNNGLKAGDAFTYDQFDAALDNAYASIEADINSVTGEQRDETISIRGQTAPRTHFLIEYVLEFLGAYKMQLFLQVKHAGDATLGTYNLWAGMDEPAKE
jgi:hypothetical protein